MTRYGEGWRGVSAALVAAALVAVFGIGSTAAGARAGPGPADRFDGEYGLFVRLVDDVLEVHWLTADETRGELRALTADGSILAERQTPAAVAHKTSFVVPDAPSVILEYGALEHGEDHHRTEIWLSEDTAPEELSYTGVDSLFVVGDTHGEFDRLARLLYQAGLIDADLRWSGSRSHLVLLGDLLDRGADVTRLLWFAYRLEREAEAAGGKLHVVLGNHEIMVMTNDLRYVSAKEFLVAVRHEEEYSELFNPHTSILGRWLATKPGIIRIDDVLLAHGGVSAEYAGYSLSEYRDSLTGFLAEDLFLRWGDSAFSADSVAWVDSSVTAAVDSASLKRRFDFFFDSTSVLWYRDYVRSDTLRDLLARVLRNLESAIHVVGHTPVRAIAQRYDGSLIAVDLHEPATEMLLLARSDEGWRRQRYSLFGPAEPLEPAAAMP